MTATIFTEEEKAELKRIASNDAALGAFSGMIFNQWQDAGGISIEELIQEALRVRLTVRKLAQ